MTQFRKIVIENYRSISYAEIDLISGIYKVVGDNQDTTYTSNGAGKSSALQAITLGLYNKDFSGAPLDSLSNRFTKKAYNITVHMLVTVDGIPSEVTVINPAGVARMRLLINGEVKATGATSVVPLVEKLLGMGYSTFKLTHFITSSTITNLVQNLSQPTLFNDILHIVELQDLDKKLLVASKEVNDALLKAKDDLQKLEQFNKINELRDKYDIKLIEGELESLEMSIDSLDLEYAEVATRLRQEVSETSSSISKLEQSIEHTRSSLREGVCSMCSSILVDKATLIELNACLSRYSDQLSVSREELRVCSGKLQVLDKKYSEQRQQLSYSSVALTQDLNIAKDIANVSLSDMPEDIPNTLEDLENQALFISTARKEIKTGRVVKNILDQFFGIVEVKLREYSELIKLDHFNISIANDRLGMIILLEQFGLDVPIDSLSNGEKTRLSLLVLISMLDAMKIVSDSETNLVILDEAASSFDKSGIEELSSLFSHLKNLGQAIFIITHGSEMDEVPYDYQLTVTKNSGTSTAIITEL